jgi:hypothetical protein
MKKFRWCGGVSHMLSDAGDRHWVTTALKALKCDPLLHRKKSGRPRVESVLRLCPAGKGVTLFLTRDASNTPVSLVVESTVAPGHTHPRIHSVMLLFDEKLFSGTVLVGTVCSCHNGEWLLLLDDCYVHAGRVVSSLPQARRHALLTEVVTRDHSVVEGQPCYLAPQRVFERAEDLTEFAKTVPYRHKGTLSRTLGGRSIDVVVSREPDSGTARKWSRDEEEGGGSAPVRAGGAQQRGRGGGGSASRGRAGRPRQQRETPGADAAGGRAGPRCPERSARIVSGGMPDLFYAVAGGGAETLGMMLVQNAAEGARLEEACASERPARVNYNTEFNKWELQA